MAKKAFVYDGSQWVDIAQSTADLSNYANMTTTPISGFRNAIINGDFRIWQRGTSFASNGYTADRWINNSLNGTTTISRQAFTAGAAPVSGYEGTFFLRAASTGGGSYSIAEQRIEDVRTFAGQTVTLSYWAKCASGTVVNDPTLVQTFGSGGSTEVTASTATATITTTWQRFTHTFTIPSIAGKTIGTNGYLNARIYRYLGSAAVTVDIWGVQIERGTIATPFEQRPIGTELALCQRYYVLVGAGGAGSVDFSTRVNIAWQFPVTMRDTPPNPTKINEPTVRVSNTTFTATASTIAATYGYTQGATVVIDGFSGLTTGWGVACVNNAAVYAFSAEL